MAFCIDELFGDEDIGELVTGVAVPNDEFWLRFSADVSPFSVFDETDNELRLFEKSVVVSVGLLKFDVLLFVVVVVDVVVVV